MSEQAKIYVNMLMERDGVPDPSVRRNVLNILADNHEAGPLKISIHKICDEARITLLDAMACMHRFYSKGYLHAFHISENMTVVFPFDYSEQHPEFVAVSPVQEVEGHL